MEERQAAELLMTPKENNIQQEVEWKAIEKPNQRIRNPVIKNYK